MAGKFECYKDKSGEYRFRLKAGNGETILSSEGYKSKDSCENGIASVQKNSANDERYEMKQTSSGKYRFNLKASNGQVIGTSQNYSSESGCRNGMDSVKRSAPGAAIDDQT
ncbi:MAG: YegP family protein [Woeseiaceae bacterium]|nr:YegP family protein [Woeseiaceae bacterium]